MSKVSKIESLVYDRVSLSADDESLIVALGSGGYSMSDRQAEISGHSIQASMVFLRLLPVCQGLLWKTEVCLWSKPFHKR